MTERKVCSHLSSEIIGVIIGRINQVVSFSVAAVLIVIYFMQIVTETKPVIVTVLALFGWFFAATIFIDAIKTRKPKQTIYFIVTSVILFLLFFAYCVLFIFILADEKSADGIPYFIPSPFLMILQLYVCYVTIKIYRELKK